MTNSTLFPFFFDKFRKFKKFWKLQYKTKHTNPSLTHKHYSINSEQEFIKTQKILLDSNDNSKFEKPKVAYNTSMQETQISLTTNFEDSKFSTIGTKSIYENIDLKKNSIVLIKYEKNLDKLKNK